MIGIASPCTNGGRVRISASANFTPMFTVSARGCTFRNIHWQYGRGNASNLIGISLTYSGNACNVFDGCDFEGPLNATEAAAAFKLINIASGCQDTFFRNSRIGAWTVQADTSSGYLVNFVGNNANTELDGCTFQLYSTSANSEFINAGVNLGGEAAVVRIKDCGFEQLDNDVTLTRAIVPPTHGQVIVAGKSYMLRATDWADAANTHVFSTVSAASESGGTATNPS